MTKKEDMLNPAHQKILTLILSSPGITTPEILEKLQMKRGTFDAAVSTLKGRRAIRLEKLRDGSRPYARYYPTEVEG